MADVHDLQYLGQTTQMLFCSNVPIGHALVVHVKPSEDNTPLEQLMHFEESQFVHKDPYFEEHTLHCEVPKS